MTTAYFKQVLVNAPGGSNAHSSDAVPTGIGKWLSADEFNSLSFHIVAAGIDAADGAVTIECSNHPDPTVSTTPPTKSGAAATLSAAGEYMISLGQHIVTEAWYRVTYAKGSNSTGTINVYTTLKG